MTKMPDVSPSPSPIARLRERVCCGACQIFLMICTAIAIISTSDAAAAYPEKPIRLVVPFSPGGSTDVVARVLGRALQDELGQTVIVDNRAGANTIIGATAVAKASADGYTLLVSIDNTWVMNQYLYDKLPYDPLGDFEPIAKIAVAPIALIASPNGPSSFTDLIQKARTNPGELSYAYGAITSQLAGEILKSELNLDLRSIAYKGSVGVVQGLMSGDVDFGIDTLAAEKEYIKTDKLRLLANMGKTPIPGFPDTPVAAAEAGMHEIDVAFWLGIAGPKGLAREIVQRLNQAISGAVQSADYIEAMASNSLVSDYLPADQFKQFIEEQTRIWGEIIPAAGIKIQ